MANFNPSFPKLKGREDYQWWKVSAQAILEMDGLWDIVIGKEAETDESKVAIMDRKAKARIILMVETVNFVHFQSETTAKGVWDKLKSAFDDTGLMRRVGLLRTLITTKLDECDNMEDFVNKIISTAHKLKGAGMDINDEWIGTLLLAGLSVRFEPMIMAIENSGIKISSDQIKTKLLQEHANNGNEKGETSMYTNTRHAHTQHHNLPSNKHEHQGQNHYGQKRYVPKCYKCGKLGHISRECRSKVAGNSNKSNRGRSESTWSCTTRNYNKNSWYIDSGASAHMAKQDDLLTEVRASISESVTVANSTSLKVEGEGQIKLASSTTDITINNVLLVPEICANLLSVSAMVNKGLRLTFDSHGCIVQDEKSGKEVATASEENGLYKLNASNRSQCGFLTPKDDFATLWHRRLGHVGFEQLRRMSADLSIPHEISQISPCEICILGKHARQPFPESNSKSKSVLEIIHSDVCGPMQMRSLQSSRYFVTFIDDFSRKVFVYGIEKKSMVVDIFKDFKMKAELQTGKKIQILRSDNGTEYCNRTMAEFLRSTGILHQTTVPYTPQQNGIAERMNRTLVEKARCMLFDARMSTKFWAEAIMTAAFVINRIPNRTCNKTPEEIWSNKKPDLSILRIFGCKAMSFIPKEKRFKFDPKSKHCIFIGYSSTTKGYRLYDPCTNKIFISRDVKFFENLQETKNYDNKTPEFSNFFFIQQNSNEVEDNSEVIPIHDNIDNNNTAAADITDDTILSDSEGDVSEYLPQPPINIEVPDEPRRSQRNRFPVQRFDNVMSATTKMCADPETVSEALSGKNAKQWRCAMDAELKSLEENKTWTLVHLPVGRKAINNKWVFKMKMGGDGKIDKFKARLVVKGCAQQKGIDYAETFSPVVRYSTIRFLLAMAAKLDLDLDHMDAVSAFLQGDLQEEIYMQQPVGAEDGSGRVCQLKKSIYGLKQASRAWNDKLGGVLIKAGLTCSKVDTCVYYRINNNDIIIIAVYVDDLLVLSNNRKTKEHIKNQLLEHFKMIDNGEAKFVLGMNIERDRQAGTIRIHQGKYLREVLDRYNMTNCNPVTTPADPNAKLSAEMSSTNAADRDEMQSIPYQEAVGSILFASQVSRPDIQFAVNMVSRYNHNYGRPHWNAVKRILRYLRGTIEMGITYKRDNSDGLHGYCDADWAGDVDDRRSVTGYVFLLQGGAITWNSKKQATVALSTTEAEYMAMSAATQEAIWLSNLHNDIFGKHNTLEHVVIYGDNKSALMLSEKTTPFHPRTKHIDIRHHFIREKVTDGTVQFIHTPTQTMSADYLTKAVSFDKHKSCRERMNVL